MHQPSSERSESCITTGLVLAGGGAKGAYQFGILKAFAEAGLEFSAVSGTSVGGLNAFLWSSGKLAAGEALWRDVTPDSIFPFKRPQSVLARARIPLMRLGALWWFSQCALPPDLDTVVGKELSASRNKITTCWGLMFLLSGFIVSLPTWSPLHLCDLPLPHFFIVVAQAVARIVVLYSASFVLTSILTFIDMRSQPPHRYVTPKASWVFFMMTPPTILLLRWGEEAGTVLAGVVVIILMPVVFAAVLYLPEGLTRLALQSSSGLRRRVETIVNGSSLRIPAWVTAAHYSDSILDPDNFVTVRIENPVAISGGKHFPRYAELNEFPAALQVDLLMATTAIPMGIVPRVKIYEERLCDGGLVNNVPVFPLLSCSRLVIVHLDSTASTEQLAYHEQCQWIDRLIRLEALNWRPGWEFSAFNEPPIMLPLRTIEPFPECLSIRPGRDLGDFWSGTMNFDSEYTVPLIQEGYEHGTRLVNAGLKAWIEGRPADTVWLREVANDGSTSGVLHANA